MKRLKKLLLPAYAYFPVLVFIVLFMSAYYVTKLLAFNLPHFDLVTPLDEMIPRWTPAVIPYVLAYVQWFLCYYTAFMQEKSICYRTASKEMLGKFLCMITFVAFPTMFFNREPLAVNNFFDWLLSLIYAADTPVNLFPSVHCFESWMCYRVLRTCKKIPRWIHVVNFIFTLTVFASTVLTKQHLVLDIPGGILFAEVGIFLSKYIKLDRFFDRFSFEKVGKKKKTES